MSKEIKVLAKTNRDNTLVKADNVSKKDGPFYCPLTSIEMIVRKCIEKRDHFAYAPKLSSMYGAKESKLHFACKEEICREMDKAFPNGDWKTEKIIPESKQKKLKKQTPDVSGRIDKKLIGIEIQKSTLSIKEINKRIEKYSARGIYVLWIVPLKNELGEEVFRPRLFEKHLHKMYYGRIYYWIIGNGTTLFPVHFEKAERWIKETSWYDSDGVEQTGGGYFKKFKVFF